MDKEQFRKVLTETYGHRPFYFRTDPECKVIRAKTPAAMANEDSTGRGIRPFYVGKKAAYPTPELIELAVKRFSDGLKSK
jgi:hypothetical protein